MRLIWPLPQQVHSLAQEKSDRDGLRHTISKLPFPRTSDPDLSWDLDVPCYTGSALLSAVGNWLASQGRGAVEPLGFQGSYV